MNGFRLCGQPAVDALGSNDRFVHFASVAKNISGGKWKFAALHQNDRVHLRSGFRQLEMLNSNFLLPSKLDDIFAQAIFVVSATRRLGLCGSVCPKVRR